jgi:hypothetical protein
MHFSLDILKFFSPTDSRFKVRKVYLTPIRVSVLANLSSPQPGLSQPSSAETRLYLPADVVSILIPETRPHEIRFEDGHEITHNRKNTMNGTIPKFHCCPSLIKINTVSFGDPRRVLLNVLRFLIRVSCQS